MARVLMLTSTLPRSRQDTSIASFVFDLAKELSQNHGHTTRILAPHMPNTPTYEVWDGVEIVRYRYFIPGFETLAQGGIMSRVKKNPGYVLMVPFFLLGIVVAVLWQLIQYKPTFIHAHWLFPQGVMVWLALLFNKTPFIVTSHGSDISQLKSSAFRTLYQWVLKRAQYFTVVSDSLLRESKPLTNKPISIIPMGIHSEFFEPAQRQRSRHLISVGRLDMDKGFQDVIRALPKLSEDIDYTIVGEGNARHELSDLAAELGVSERVTLVGSKSAQEIKVLFDQSALFIHPSRHEGFGLVVVEAMASRIPVLTSDIEALQVHTQEGRGISLNTQDTSALVEGITKALTDALGENIEKAYTYSSQYRWDRVAESFDRLYQQILE